MGAVLVLLCGPSIGAAQTDTTITRADSSRDSTAIPRFGGIRHTAGILTSGFVGFGLGHLIIGDRPRFKRFALMEAGGLLAFGVGAGLGVGSTCEDVRKCPGIAVAAGLAFGGIYTYIGSRLWELMDVTMRPALWPKAATAAPRDSVPLAPARLSVAPVVLPRDVGLAVSVRW
jgi:hypothetical protein